MKVLEVQSLHSGIDQIKKSIEIKQEQMNGIHEKIKTLVGLEDQLKGAGGEAIRSFYQEYHETFLTFYDSFSNKYKILLELMNQALSNLEPDNKGYINEAFIDLNVDMGLKIIERTGTELTDEANQAMDQVADIVSLPHLNDEAFHQGVRAARNHSLDTVEKLTAFDAAQTKALDAIEQDVERMTSYIQELSSVFQQGNFRIDDKTTFPLSVNPNFKQIYSDVDPETNAEQIEDIKDDYPEWLEEIKKIMKENGIEITDIGIINAIRAFKGYDPKTGKKLNTKEREVALGIVLASFRDKNGFEKSIDSFKEIWNDFTTGLEVRADKALDSWYDFGNYLIMGSFDLIKNFSQGLEDRNEKKFNSVADFINYLTIGGVDLVKGAVNPEEPYSKEHWLSSLALASLLTGPKAVVEKPPKVVSPGKKTNIPAKNKDTHLENVDKSGNGTKGTSNATKWTRANRMGEYEKWLDNGLKVNGKKYEINEHVINSLKKSGRKDIMPDQITRALKQKPTNGDRFSWIYTDPKTGVKIYVNEFKDIVGVQPGKFK